MNHLPNNIKTIREVCEYTQEDFAAILGITRGKLATYERGVQPKIDFVIKLSDVVAIPIDYLIKSAVTKPNTLFGTRQRKLQYLANIHAYTNNLTNAQ